MMDSFDGPKKRFLQKEEPFFVNRWMTLLLVAFGSCCREETVIHFEHECCETGSVMNRKWSVSFKQITHGFEFTSLSYIFVGSVRILIIKNLVAEHFVVKVPVITASIDHGLSMVIVTVKVSEWSVPIKLGVVFDVWLSRVGIVVKLFPPLGVSIPPWACSRLKFLDVCWINQAEFPKSFFLQLQSWVNRGSGGMDDLEPVTSDEESQTQEVVDVEPASQVAKETRKEGDYGW